MFWIIKKVTCLMGLVLVLGMAACTSTPSVSEPSPQPSSSVQEPMDTAEQPQPSAEPLQPSTEPSPSPTPLDVFATMQDFYLAQSQNYSNCREEKIAVPRDVEVRKSFLPTQALQAGQEEFAFELNLNSGADLKRRMLFNLRHGEIPVDSVHVRVNGTELKTFFPDDSALISEAPDMVWDLCSYLHEGQNRLSIAVSGEANSSVEIFVDGFIMPVDIPEAFHSVGGLHSARDAASALMWIKFIEEMRVRLQSEHDLPEQLVDLSGISLYPLQVLLRHFPVDGIYDDSSLYTSEELDLMEKDMEKEWPDYPNGNLSYNIFFIENDILKSNMQYFIDILLKIPIFEDATFEPEWEDP